MRILQEKVIYVICHGYNLCCWSVCWRGVRYYDPVWHSGDGFYNQSLTLGRICVRVCTRECVKRQAEWQSDWTKRVRSVVVTGEFPHKDQWHGVWMLSLICAWISQGINSRNVGKLFWRQAITRTNDNRVHWGIYIRHQGEMLDGTPQGLPQIMTS